MIGAIAPVAGAGSIVGGVLSGPSVEQGLYIAFGVLALVSLVLVAWSAARHG